METLFIWTRKVSWWWDLRIRLAKARRPYKLSWLELFSCVWPRAHLAWASFFFRLNWARQKLALANPNKIHIWAYMSHLTCGLRPDLFVEGPIHFWDREIWHMHIFLWEKKRASERQSRGGSSPWEILWEPCTRGKTSHERPTGKANYPTNIQHTLSYTSRVVSCLIILRIKLSWISFYKIKYQIKNKIKVRLISQSMIFEDHWEMYTQVSTTTNPLFIFNHLLIWYSYLSKVIFCM